MVPTAYICAACLVLLLLAIVYYVARHGGGSAHGGNHGGNGMLVKGIQKINDKVSIYRPEVECTPVTCMESLGGTCVSGKCEYPGPYKPFTVYPHAMATNYCELETGGCSGAIGDPRPAIKKIRDGVLAGAAPESPPGGEVTAATRFGVTANPPLMIGNSGVGVNSATGKPVKSSYQGASEVSGVCYDVEGPGGRAILVAGDRCGGYCLEGCGKTGPGAEECGSCVGAVHGEPTPNPPCVGTVPGLYDECRGEAVYGCAAPVVSECDWCASQNHPHFDLDNKTFATVCGSAGGVGSCELTRVTPFRCAQPGGLPSGGSCPYPSSYDNGSAPCGQAAAQYAGSGGAVCCCPWGSVPDPKTSKCVPAAPVPPAEKSCPYPGSRDSGSASCADAAAQYTGPAGELCCCPPGTVPDSASAACVPAHHGPSPPPQTCTYPGSYQNGATPCAQPGAQYSSAGGKVCCCPWDTTPDSATSTCVPINAF